MKPAASPAENATRVGAALTQMRPSSSWTYRESPHDPFVTPSRLTQRAPVETGGSVLK